MASRRELVDALDALCRHIRYGTGVHKDGVLLARSEALVERARRGLQDAIPWTPFAAAEPASEATGFAACRVNSRYQVLIRYLPNDGQHLSIKRIDQAPIHSWRDLQRIKDELVGPECEALELYPANSRLVDASTQYHLWACADPTFRFPIGMEERDVQTPEQVRDTSARQEPFEE